VRDRYPLLGHGCLSSFRAAHSCTHIQHILLYPCLQIKAARQVKKLMTGQLTSQVSAYPVFPGAETNFLRAQVADVDGQWWGRWTNPACCPSLQELL